MQNSYSDKLTQLSEEPFGDSVQTEEPEEEKSAEIYVRCVYCMGGNEEKVKQLIEKKYPGEVMIPMKEKPFKVKGEWTTVHERLMPGYLFVFSDQDEELSLLRSMDGVIRVLSYGADLNDTYLRGTDLKFALMLKRHEGLVAKLKAVKEGDFIKITEGPMAEMHGKVIGINKGRHMVNIELEFFGRPTSVWLGFEVVEKDQ